MAGKIKKFLFKSYNNIFVLSGILMLLFACGIYLLLGKQAADTLSEQMLHREQSIAKSGANFISSFFVYLGKSVVTLSEGDEIKGYNQRSQTSMDKFITLWAGTPVGAINLSDSSGMLRFGSTREQTGATLASISDRDYFIWAQTAKSGEAKVFTPFESRLGPTKGTFIVPVASPVIEGGKFKGALMASVRLGELADKFLTPLKISDKTRLLMISSDGTVFHSDENELIGMNVLQILAEDPFLGAKVLGDKVKTILQSGTEGKTTLALPSVKGSKTIKQYLIAYSPINLDGGSAYLVVATPRDDALTYLTPFYFRNLGLAALAGLGFLIITIRISKIKGHKEGVEEEHAVHSDSTPPEVSS